MTKFFKADGSVSKTGDYALLNLRIQADRQKRVRGRVRFHGCHWSYRWGGWTQLSTTLADTIRDALHSLKIDYTEGNDAPRGGAAGAYLEFSYAVFNRRLAKRLAAVNSVTEVTK